MRKIIDVIRMYYVTTTDETKIIYKYRRYPSKKEEEGYFTFKGRFLKEPTDFNVINFLNEKLNN